MSHYIEHMLAAVKPENRVEGGYSVPNWQYRFDFGKHPVLHDWAKDVEGVATIANAIGELNWLVSPCTDLSELHAAGHHHRDHYALSEDLVAEMKLEPEERINLAFAKLNEAGAGLNDPTDVRNYFVDNGFMVRYLTLDKCLTEIGVPETEERKLFDKGFIGSNHGLAFGVATPLGDIQFHRPEWIPAYGTEFYECIQNQTFTYIPNQVNLRFIQHMLSVKQRLELIDPEVNRDVILAFEAYQAGEANELLEMAGITVEPGETKDAIPDDVAHAVFDAAGIEGRHVHVKLHLMAYNGLYDYGIEVLPYVLYSLEVMRRKNLTAKSFTIAADSFELRDEDVAILESLALLPDGPVNEVEVVRDPSLTYEDKPFTLDDFNIVEYAMLVEKDETESTPTQVVPVEGDTVEPAAEVNQAYEG